MKLASLQDLYLDELKDLYNAENQLLKALPKMAEAASSTELRECFEEHLEQTRGHVRRLDQVLKGIGADGKGKPCRAMEGLIAESEEMIKERATPEVKDAGLISMAQRVEHYEMAGYGSVRTYARELGDEEAARMLQMTLDEEGAADKKLTALAERRINKMAMQHSSKVRQ